MNLCEDYPGSRPIFRSYSTNNLDTISYRKPVPLRVSATDYFEQEQTHSKSETDAKAVAKNQESSRRPSMKRTTSALQLRRRCFTISEHELKESEQTLKHAKSFSISKSTGEQQEQKKYSFKKFFDKKKSSLVASQERSEHDSATHVNTSKKIKSKPLRLRSLSSSCLSLAGKSRPKLINRLSCPDNLIPADKKTTLNHDQTVSLRGTKAVGTKAVDTTPTGESYACTTKTANVTARLKDSFKYRHSRELTKRDSQILVTRFEVELAITKDDRNKLLSFINSKSINLNAKDYYGKTLLHTACSVGNYQCAQILINAGGKIDIQDQAGFTPLHCAVVANHVPCAAVMISAGADVMVSTRTMHTALTLAHEEEMILLVGRSLLLREIMDVQVRLARSTDLASVIELSKGVYQGHDYLPLAFLQWLEEPNRRVIVAETRGVVIGIRAFHIVDGGKTVVSQGLRVHPKYRGQGVSTVLIRAQQHYVQTQFPSAVTERYTTMSNNVGRLAIQRKSVGENLVLELGIIAFYANSTLLSNQSEIACANNQVRNIDAMEFQKLLEEGKLDNVLEKDSLIIDWEPYKSLPCNIAGGLVNENDCLFVSETLHGKKSIKCFSHGRLSPRVKCLHWVATIYTKNLKLLKMHIAKQLKYAKLQSGKKNFIFSCFLPTCFVSDAKQYVVEEFLLEHADFFNFNLLLFEKKSCM